MSTPRMVTLDRDTMSGYLLNVLGTDQIHDFCGGRLKNAIPTINQFFEKRKQEHEYNSRMTKRQKIGGDSSVIQPYSEVIEAQCLELIHIFVNTIMANFLIII